MEQNQPYFEPPESHKPVKKRWAFLRRGRTRGAESNKLYEPVAEKPDSSTAKNFARKIIHLLSNTEAPLNEPVSPTPEARTHAETNEDPIETIVTRRRKWGEKVLLLVATTSKKVRRTPQTPEREVNEKILDDASADMQGAQDDLANASRESTPPEHSPHFTQAVKSEVKRTLRNIKVERERLRHAEPPSETAQMLTLGVLALFGGGLLLPAWQEQKVKKVSRKLAKQEKIISEQTTTLKTLEHQVKTHMHSPEVKLVQRIGSFTHEQAALTREVAQEVREYKAEARQTLQTPEATFKIPESLPAQSSPEFLKHSHQAQQADQSTEHTASNSHMSQQTSAIQEPKSTPKKTSKTKPDNNDPLAKYALVLVVIATALAIWFLFLR